MCGAEAQVYLRYARAAFCAKHFVEYIEGRVRRTMERYAMLRPGERVVVAVSGGKDSVTLAALLARILGGEAPERMLMLYMDLGIKGYSDKLREAVERLSGELGVKLMVVSLEELVGVASIYELARRARRATCSVCGTVKRYVMNAVAVEAGAVLATGHTLDDALAYIVKDFMYQDQERLSKWVPRTPAAPGAAPRIRPLIEVSERETLLYALMRGLPFVHEECPHRPRDSVEDATKDYLNRVEEAHPGTKISFLRRVVSRAAATGADEGGTPRTCTICGLVSRGDVCSFCRLTQRVLGEPMGPRVRRVVREKLASLGWL